MEFVAFCDIPGFYHNGNPLQNWTYLSEMKTYWSSPHITLLYKITGKGSIVLAELAYKDTVMLGYYKFYENPKLPAKFLEHIIYSIFHGKGMRVKKKKKKNKTYYEIHYYMLY